MGRSDDTKRLAHKIGLPKKPFGFHADSNAINYTHKNSDGNLHDKLVRAGFKRESNGHYSHPEGHTAHVNAYQAHQTGVTVKAHRKLKEDVNEIFGWGKKKPEPTKDELKAMHDVLVAHHYRSQDHKTYHHRVGDHRAHLRPHHLYRDKDHKTKLGGPNVHHSTGERFLDSKSLETHLKKIHEDAPTNCMGASSATTGPIVGYDPLFLKKKLGKPDKFSMFVRKKGKSDGN